MEIRSLLQCVLLGTFILLAFQPSFSLSDSPAEFSFQHSSRRLLKTSPRETIGQYLIPHNKMRAKLGLPPLKWSKKLAKFASWWAHQRQEDCSLIHTHSNFGENLFWGSGKDWKPEDAVAAWAAEKSYYNHKSNSCTQNKDCLHYTQIVWKESSKIGCAKAACKNGDTFIICNYDPHGNVVGQKPF